jgi:acyl-CoA dehydrogenase
MVKMKVTTQGEEVINRMWDAIAAKGFEKDQYFSQAAVDIRALPKLEGTVHVNIALIAKFMPNFFFNPGDYPDVPQQNQAVNDDFLFNQGGAKGLGQIQFNDYHRAFEGVDLPNVREFLDQTETFRELLATDPPGPEQMKDVDFLMAGGEIFALVVYAQLLLENARIYNVDDDLLDQIFDFMVRDMSGFALELYSRPSSTPKQMDLCQKIIRKAVSDPERTGRVWDNHIAPLDGAYEMNR